MRSLFDMSGTVPLSRVVRDYRRWILPIAIALVAAVGVLVGVVLPMAATADASERRAAAARESRDRAAGEFSAAEQTRDAQTQAAKDLDQFYRQVLPADVAAARRVTHLKLSQMAREHGVSFQRSAASPETIRGSTLERLRVSYSLSGSYDDIRRLIHDIETASDFILIDNVFLSEGEDAQAPLSLTLELSTFYRPVTHGP
jgi:Tfp pilus assembly protein PilO